MRPNATFHHLPGNIIASRSRHYRRMSAVYRDGTADELAQHG